VRSASAHYTLRESALDGRAALLRLPPPAADNPRA
jgi:hypothetical protein